MEIDVDDVPWKDELVTHRPEIVNGYIATPKGPGWGTAIVEEVAREHAWDPQKSLHQKNLPPARSY
jgi:L-alanine-DL-glutamate epimerase-like enolase superfamily enzyme